MLHPCIYCRRGDVPRTREHVLQAAFGAVATLPNEVCAECNAAFSAIDKEFVDAVNFYHLGKNMFRGLGFGTTMHDGHRVLARMRSDGLGEFPPQLYEVGSKEWRFLGHSVEQAQRMLAELAEPATLQINESVVPCEEGTPRLAIVRSRPRVYLVRGVDADSVSNLASQLRKGGFQPDWLGTPTSRSSESPPPSIHYPTALHFVPYCRALAKIALNFVCYRFGAETALKAEFNELRTFARNGGSPFDHVLPTLLNHSIEDSGAAYFGPHHHGLLLVKIETDEGEREAVFVVLGGKTIARVDLTRGRGGLPEPTWILLSRFDADQRAVDDFTLPNDMPRAVINPGAFGLQDIWPKEWQ